jgi:hypothetical protein
MEKKGLKANFVAVIIKESDLYSEILFLLCFVCLSLGLVAALFFERSVERPLDLLIFPTLGFCVGSTLFHYKSIYLKKIASKAVRLRVNQKAKAIFYDHQKNHKGPLLFFFFSELEKEALLLSSVEFDSILPQDIIKERLKSFANSYSKKNPLKSFVPMLHDLSHILKMALANSTITSMHEQGTSAPLYFISSGNKEDPMPIAVLKGNKDVN